MSTSRSADNVKAGFFVLITIVLAVAIIVTLAGVRESLRPAHAYTVRFSVQEGAAGLETGSEVRVGGRAVGRVSGVRFSGEDPMTPDFVDVTIRIDRSLTLHDDAVGFLERPLLGAGATINFLSLGGGPGALALAEGGVVRGAIAAPDILTRAGYGPEQTTQLQRIMQRADDLTLRFDTLAARLETEFMPVASDSLADLRAITADARERSTVWFDRVDDITENLHAVSSDTRTGVEEARTLVERLRALVDDNREAIDSIVANADEASERANTILTRVDQETLELVNGALRDGREGVSEARAAVEKLDALIVEQTPSLRKSIANLRLASDQMRLTMGEVRRSPWRLLHRPDKKELEFELLYDATRAYADAVSDLRAASESLETIAAQNTDRSGDAQRVEDVLADMQDAFIRYQSAEARFMRLLGANAP